MHNFVGRFSLERFRAAVFVVSAVCGLSYLRLGMGEGSVRGGMPKLKFYLHDPGMC